jgi:regulator of replication initiation timing
VADKAARFTARRVEILVALAELGGSVEDRSGRAQLTLLERVGGASRSAFSQLLRAMAADGLIERDTQATAVYRVALADDLPDRYIAAIEEELPGFYAEPVADEPAVEEPEPELELEEEPVEEPATAPVAPPPTTGLGDEDLERLALTLLRTAAQAIDAPQIAKAELDQARERLAEARRRLGETLDEVRRYKSRVGLLEEENGHLKRRVAELNRRLSEADANLATMTRDFRKAVKNELSDRDRRAIERAITQQPAGAVL